VTTALIEMLAALPAVAWLVAAATRRSRGRPIAAFVRTTILAVLLSFVLAHINRWFDLWKAHPYFPSGHETFAACMATALVVLGRRTLVPMLALLALLGYLLVRMGWHGRFEVVAGAALGAAVTLAVVQVNRALTRTP